MDFYKAYDLLDNVRERLEATISNSSVDLMASDTDDFFITVTQRNEITGNESTWSFCVDFGTNKVQMLEPTEDEESFGNVSEVFGIIKNFLNGGMSKEKRFGNKIDSSKKSIKSSLLDVNKALGFTDNDIEEDGKIHITTDLGEFVVDYVNDEYIVSYDGEERTFTEYKDTVEEVVDLFNKLCNEEVELFNKNINSSKPIKSSHDRETLQKVIRAYLDKMGYKDVEGGVDAAADYILQNEEYYPDYDLHLKVKKWFNDTKENYPEALIKASRTIKSSFTQDELNCLREMIVDGMDKRFYDWYSEKYGDEPWKASNEQMAEWIKSDPEITKEYSDYLEREMPYYEPGHDEKEELNI